MMMHRKRILLTGASGWFGKSFILSYVAQFSEKALSNLVLVTSDGRDINVPGINAVLKTIPLKYINDINDVDVVVQSAFLTRDKIIEYGDDRYKAINLNIIDTVSNYVKVNEISSVFLISSGAVNDPLNKRDLYSDLKYFEEESFSSVCKPFVFRVYGAAGKLTPNNNWSALSDFIKRGKAKQDILIRANGQVLRSYVSFDILSTLIIKLINKDRQAGFVIDACTHSIDICDLAKNVADLFRTKVVVGENYEPSVLVDSYIGENFQFIKECDQNKVEQIDIRELVFISSNSPFL